MRGVFLYRVIGCNNHMCDNEEYGFKSRIDTVGEAEIALLSQEGSMIEMKSRSGEGWFLQRYTDKWFLLLGKALKIRTEMIPRT